MKAMILAAGVGSRLQPLTDLIPKPMVPIAGRPIIEYTVASLAAHQIRDLVINLHHRPETVREHLGDGRQWGARIQYSFEKELRGTAGALKPWRAFFDGTFLVVYGDNLTTCDFGRMVDFHRANAAFVTMALSHREDVSQSGIAALDGSGRILRFIEKPVAGEEFSQWVNAGILVLEPGAIDLIADGRASDFSRELLPQWIADGRRVFGYRMSPAERLWWIDRPEDLVRVQQELTGGAAL